MSGQKAWDQLSYAEKIEELHGALISHQRAHDALAAMASRDRAALKELGAAVADLRRRLDQANLPPPA
jgi:lactam utilization protein B